MFLKKTLVWEKLVLVDLFKKIGFQIFLSCYFLKFLQYRYWYRYRGTDRYQYRYRGSGTFFQYRVQPWIKKGQSRPIIGRYRTEEDETFERPANRDGMVIGKQLRCDWQVTRSSSCFVGSWLHWLPVFLNRGPFYRHFCKLSLFPFQNTIPNFRSNFFVGS